MNIKKPINPFLFACGVPRSGTTLLQRMLNSHPELAVANDTHFIPRALEMTDKSLIEAACAGSPIPLTPELAGNVDQYHRFRRLEILPQEFDAAVRKSETYQQLVVCLYDSYARQNNKPLAGEKTPDYVRRLDLLHGLFPSAKLIHLVRDGRNVALSLLQWATATKGPGRIALWNENPVAVCALWWSWLVTESRKQAATIDPSVLVEVRYEDLVTQPGDTIATVCEFLDLVNSDQMLEYHRGKSKPGTQLSAKSAWLTPQTGLRDWRTDMEAEQIELFEALATNALQEFGYELSVDRFSDRTLETAEHCRSWWEQHFLPKHQSANSATQANVGPVPVADLTAQSKRPV